MNRPGEADAVAAALGTPGIGGNVLIREFRAIIAAAYPPIFEAGRRAGRREGRREEAQEVAAALRDTVAKLGDIARQMP